jgi:hypothetical protein
MSAAELFSIKGEVQTPRYKKLERREELKLYLGISVGEENNHDKTHNLQIYNNSIII